MYWSISDRLIFAAKSTAKWSVNNTDLPDFGPQSRYDETFPGEPIIRMSFFEELKRRNVVRVGLAYVVIGWLLAQVAELAFDTFGAPDWVLKSFLFVLLLGLPLALFFAWAFEFTPEGVKREKDVDRSQSITAQTGRKLDYIIIGVLVFAVGFLLVERFVPAGSPPITDEVVATQSQSIAVIPFVNMSDDKDYFADGLSEELLNLLAKIPGLKVAGRTSSFAFKGRNDDFRIIGDALNVEHVLEGSVRRSGDTLRVTAQLIKVDDGYHIWSETYDRELADIFAIQDDVAGAITTELKLRLVPATKRSTDNTEAYAYYLEAVALQMYSTVEDVVLAQQLLDQAIALDPGFARAYELKSNYYWLEAGWFTDAPKAQVLAYESAMKALELDPTLVGARSYAETARPDWSWTIEIEALEEAVRAEPENILALDALSYDLIIAGYFEESMRLAQRIIDLEPLAPGGYWRAGEILMAAGRRDEALVHMKRAVELGAHEMTLYLAADALVQGNDESAIDLYEKYLAGIGADPSTIRTVIENTSNAETGKLFLDQWIAAAVAEAANIDELRQAYIWYLSFGYLDDFWLAIETLGGVTILGWTNADTLDWAAFQF